MPRALEGFFVEVGRFFDLLWRTLAWTVRPPYDWRELVRQMANIGVGRPRWSCSPPSSPAW